MDKKCGLERGERRACKKKVNFNCEHCTNMTTILDSKATSFTV